MLRTLPHAFVMLPSVRDTRLFKYTHSNYGIWSLFPNPVSYIKVAFYVDIYFTPSPTDCTCIWSHGYSFGPLPYGCDLIMFIFILIYIFPSLLHVRSPAQRKQLQSLEAREQRLLRKLSGREEEGRVASFPPLLPCSSHLPRCSLVPRLLWFAQKKSSLPFVDFFTSEGSLGTRPTEMYDICPQGTGSWS